MHQPGFAAQLFGYFDETALESDVCGKEDTVSNLLQNVLIHGVQGQKAKNICYYFCFSIDFYTSRVHMGGESFEPVSSHVI